MTSILLTTLKLFKTSQVTVSSFEVGWNFTDGEFIESPQDVFSVTGNVTPITLSNNQVLSGRDALDEDLEGVQDSLRVAVEICDLNPRGPAAYLVETTCHATMHE